MMIKIMKLMKVYLSLLDDFESNKPMKINSDRRCKYNRCATQTQEELDQCLTLPTLQRSKDPLLWWKKNQETLPILGNLASKYLSAPPSSVESERLFSI